MLEAGLLVRMKMRPEGEEDEKGLRKRRERDGVRASWAKDGDGGWWRTGEVSRRGTRLRHTCGTGLALTVQKDGRRPNNNEQGNGRDQQVAVGEGKDGKRHCRGVELLRWVNLDIELYGME